MSLLQTGGPGERRQKKVYWGITTYLDEANGVNLLSNCWGEVVVATSRMKLRVVCRKVYDYVRYDLKEIAFPSSLPDPPHIKKRPKLTWKDKWCILREASRLYGASWVRNIGPELRPNDYRKAEEESGSNTEEATREPTVLEDLAAAARGGAEALKPALRRIYMTRASTYTNALKSYVESYQEGLKGLMEEKAVGKGPQGNEPTKPPPSL